MKGEYKFLGRVNSPEELKQLKRDEISELCEEIRDKIIATTSINGGHPASNLGVVELTVAIHRVFNSPEDHIIFDVGHQSYTHKLLTGRYEGFDTLREAGGITGFTNREESEHDCFGAGHSSTSLSAGLGFAISDKLAGSDAYTVVVLGDGAFTGGMIHEALNNCARDLKLIIILNENEMSISKNIGRFAKSIAKLRRKKGYYKTKRATANFIKKIPFLGNWLFCKMRDAKKSLKDKLYGSNYFEDMGLYYLGPADGNNYDDVEALLEAAKSAGESVLIHLKTQKGKGYAPAEENPDKYHGLKPREDVAVENSFSAEFGKAICDIAENDDKICAITAAMSSGTGLDPFAAKFPERFFDVGIAEEHAVTFAAGLSANGYKPVFAVYSSFLQRSYDQLIHDVALQSLPVVICVDRAGFNNSDGSTHHGIFDVAFASQIPNVRIYTPVTYEGVRRSLKSALSSGSPAIIRYPSGEECGKIVAEFYSDGEDKCQNVGLRFDSSFDRNSKCIIITHGKISAQCIEAKHILAERGITVGIILCEYLAPYDELCQEIGKIIDGVSCDAIFFVEEEIKSGGFGMNLSIRLAQNGYLNEKDYYICATDDPFVKREVGQTYLEAAGLSGSSLAEFINKKIT